MRILFITSSRIGDAVLSTGLLRHIEQTWPQAKVTIVCGPLVTSLFAGYPLLDQIIPLRKQKHNAHWLKLWQCTIGTPWDMVIDLRNSAVSRLLRARRRFIFGRHINAKTHKVEQNAAVMRLPDPPAPHLWFSKDQKAAALNFISEGRPVLAVGPTANWIGKTWPAERFIEIIEFMTGEEGVMPGARVVVFAAPGEEPAARQILSSIPEARQIDMIAKTDPGTAAATLARCDFYIGNDSGLMHCAAACGVPTLGLFGPSYPEIYAPWGPHTRFVQTPENFDQLIDFPGYSVQTLNHSLMESLSVDAVKTAITKFWAERQAA